MFVSHVFRSPDREGFTFETEAEGVVEPELTDDFAEAGWGEDPPVSRIPGRGRTGWVVAVSRLPPFAGLYHAVRVALLGEEEFAEVTNSSSRVSCETGVKKPP